MKFFAMTLTFLTVTLFGQVGMACDQSCLEEIGQKYITAYMKNDVSAVPVSGNIDFTENNARLKFPDGSWDVAKTTLGDLLLFSDEALQTVGIFMTVYQNDVPGYLAARLKIKNSKIIEIEHMLSTRKAVGGPPTPFGDPAEFKRDPEMHRILGDKEKTGRAEMVKQSDGYFSTLEKNNGTLRARFSPRCHRRENGKEYAKNGCEKGFLKGFYGFNNRVRDRDYFLVDERRGLVMARAYIDHKGVMTSYKLTDGTQRKSPFPTPHSWSVLEVFKILDGQLGPIEAVFIAVPYGLPSPWPAIRKTND